MKIYIPKRNNNRADYLEKDIREILINNNYQIVEDPKKSDYILSIGGDGTLLHNIYTYRDLDIPIISANGGSVGHHAYIKRDNLLDSISNLKKQIIYSYNFIKASTDDGFSDFAAQDIRVERPDHHAIVIEIKVNEKTIAKRHLADGVIISNAFGITGYNISAGGLRNKIKNNELIMTPICPFSLYPEVYDSLNESRLVKNSIIKITPEKGARLVLDNRAHIIQKGTTIKINISDDSFKIITPNP